LCNFEQRNFEFGDKIKIRSAASFDTFVEQGVRDAIDARDLRCNGDPETGRPVKRLRDGVERSFGMCL
jgi:hypothetical protein